MAVQTSGSKREARAEWLCGSCHSRDSFNFPFLLQRSCLRLSEANGVAPHPAISALAGSGSLGLQRGTVPMAHFLEVNLLPKSTNCLSICAKFMILRKATKLVNAYGGIGCLFLQKQPSHYKPEWRFRSLAKKLWYSKRDSNSHLKLLGKLDKLLCVQTPPPPPISQKS